MTFTNVDTIFYTLAFLVPGFIADAAIGVLVPRREGSGQVAVLRFLTLSCVNYGLWSWLIVYIVASGGGRPGLVAAAWAWIIFFAPAGLGLMSGLMAQRGTLRRLLERYGISAVHPVPTAWDWVFSTTGPSWTIVTLRDGSQVAGLFSSRSFASSDPNERDVFLERVYRIEEEGEPWARVDRSAGIWIAAPEIRHIEFLGLA